MRLGSGLATTSLVACQLLVGVEERSERVEVATSAADAAGLQVADAGGPPRPRDAGCDPGKPFDAPELLAELSSPYGEFGATLSADELEIFYTTTAPGKSVVHRATRARRDAPFSPGTVVDELRAIPAPHWSLSLSADGTRLLVTAKAPPRDVFVARRAARGEPFGEPSRLAWSGWNLGSGEEHVFAGARGQLYLGVQAGPQFDLFVVPPSLDGGPTRPQPLVFFNTEGGSEAWPVESFDGLTFLYASGTGEASEILESRRTTLDAPFGPGAALSFPLSPRKHPLWLSPDGCRLYLSQDNAPGGAGGADLWVAERPPP